MQNKENIMQYRVNLCDEQSIRYLEKFLTVGEKVIIFSQVDKSIGEYLLFTDRRIIVIDQGYTISFMSFPYKSISSYSVEVKDQIGTASLCTGYCFSFVDGEKLNVGIMGDYFFTDITCCIDSCIL